VLSLIILILLDIFSFYGLYTNKFYLFKIDNYIFPLLSIVHFVFLYVLWFKVKENELSDPPMRNLEYVLYFISLVYIYKIIETLVTLVGHVEFEKHLIPATFLPIGCFILFLYIILFTLTYLAIGYRIELVGSYRFDEMNQHVDSWK